MVLGGYGGDEVVAAVDGRHGGGESGGDEGSAWNWSNLAASSPLPSASDATSYGAGAGMSPVVFSPADSVSGRR